MRYIVDIDNTICATPADNNYPTCIPYLDRIAKVNKLYDDGHTIIYWTARGSSSGIDWTDLTKQQLDTWGCKYHEVQLKKPSYDIWIDDKAVNSEDYFGQSAG